MLKITFFDGEVVYCDIILSKHGFLLYADGEYTDIESVDRIEVAA